MISKWNVFELLLVFLFLRGRQLTKINARLWCLKKDQWEYIKKREILLDINDRHILGKVMKHFTFKKIVHNCSGNNKMLQLYELDDEMFERIAMIECD